MACNLILRASCLHGKTAEKGHAVDWCRGGGAYNIKKLALKYQVSSQSD